MLLTESGRRLLEYAERSLEEEHNVLADIGNIRQGIASSLQIANDVERDPDGTYVIPNMFARAVRGQMDPQASVQRAHRECERVFANWRKRGLIGGG